MEKGNLIDSGKLNRWSKEIYACAEAHGFKHDKPNNQFFLGMILTEIAELIEADRNGKRANTQAMAELLEAQAKSKEGLSDGWFDMWYSDYYNLYVKGSIEEEFADVVIRILDLARWCHGDNMVWSLPFPVRIPPYATNVPSRAWHFVKNVLSWGQLNLSDSVNYMYQWASSMGIDLDTHVEWKMKYNEFREYRHGNKKY